MRVLSKEDTILFIGSGISCASGLPSWERLLSGLIEKCEAIDNCKFSAARDRVSKGEYLSAADRIYQKLQPTEISNVLREAFQFHMARPCRLHRLIRHLGPTCFITTNYDHLIENEYILSTHTGLRVVKNRETASIADITRADARNFVFKPHGDFDDPNSIILSEEQYNSIILGTPDMAAAKYCLDALLTTRPVVFIGYSLSDPDIKILLDKSRNAFGVSTGEIWAIIANASNEDIEFYWKRYKIRILGYDAPEQPGGGTDHSLLGRILECSAKDPDIIDIRSVQDKFSVARYGAGLSQNTATGLPLQYYRDYSWRPRISTAALKDYKQGYVSDLIANFPNSLILVGPAGCGKSFSLKNYMAKAGESLRDWALQGSPLDVVEFPILLDARQYNGSFDKLLNLSVPRDVVLSDLESNVKVSFLVDSLDEMPSNFLGSPDWHDDLRKLLLRRPGARCVFGTRRADLVPLPDLPTFQIRPLSNEVVSERLAEADISFKRLRDQTRSVVSSPFALKLLLDPRSKPHDSTLPYDLFAGFVNRAISEAGFAASSRRVVAALETLAFNANSAGRDTLQIERVDALVSAAVGFGTERIGPADRLVSAGLFSSEIEGQVRFAHRSLLEHLAAGELVRHLDEDQTRVVPFLGSHRWDNVIVTSYSRLSPASQTKLMSVCFSWDPRLSVRLARFAESGQEEIVEALLQKLLNHVTDDFLISYELQHLPIPKHLVPLLWKLFDVEIYRGFAGSKIIELGSIDDFHRILEKISRGQIDFNAANEIGVALAGRLKPSAFIELLVKSEGALLEDRRRRQEGERDSYEHGLENLISTYVGKVGEVGRAAIFSKATKLSHELQSALISGGGHQKSSSYRKFVYGCFDRSIIESTFPLSLNIKSDIESGWEFAFSEARWQILRQFSSERSEVGSWSFVLLQRLITNQIDWEARAREALPTEEGLFGSAIRLSLRETQIAEAHQILDRCRDASQSDDDLVLMQLVDENALLSAQSVILDILSRREGRVVEEVSQRLSLHDVTFDSVSLEHCVAILDNANKLYDADSSAVWTYYNAMKFLAASVSEDVAKALAARVNQSDRNFYTVPGMVLFCDLCDVRSFSEQVSSDSMNRIVDVYITRFKEFSGFVDLGRCLSEKFIETMLLPRLADEEPRSEALIDLLRAAGEAHGRRYVAVSPETGT